MHRRGDHGIELMLQAAVDGPIKGIEQVAGVLGVRFTHGFRIRGLAMRYPQLSCLLWHTLRSPVGHEFYRQL